MSKNIVIQEGGVGRQFTADKLKTALVGGGSCNWVPEDETQLGTKHITEDGTYNAIDDCYYGYSQVTVSGIGKAAGIDPATGDYVQVTTDPETGNITEKTIPASIKITKEPTKIEYTDGDLIDFAGLEVTLKTKAGSVFTDENYSNGKIPIAELNFPDRVADISKISQREASAGDVSILQYPKNDPIILCNPVGVSDWPSPNGNRGYRYNVVASGEVFGVVVKNSEYSYNMWLYSRSQFSVGRRWGTFENMDIPEASDPASIRHYDNIEGDVYFALWGSSQEVPPFPLNIFDGEYSGVDFAVQIFGANSTISGGTQEIPVKWVSQYDGIEYGDSFNISVNPQEELT